MVATLVIHSGSSQIAFENQATSLGLIATNGNSFLGNGITFFDYNNDGWDDMSITTGSNLPLKFFRNNNGNFIQDTFTMPPFNYQTRQINWVDFDNDGDKDLFITSDTNGNRLLMQTDAMVFQDITQSSGILATNMLSYGASWGDYDNDGLLDVFVSNRSTETPNKLYKNNGDQTFTDVSVQVGLDQEAMYSFCSAFLDINNDGLQDIYVANDKYIHPNKLYKNNGDGTFSDISESSGTGVYMDAMSVTVGDYDNDGWFDIYITNTQNGNVLFKNNGDETFTNMATASNTLFNSIGWGAVFLDADNDTNLDLYVSSEYNNPNSGYLLSAFYENNGDETFTLSNQCFPGDNGSGHSNAVGDLDNDGYADLVVSNNYNEPVFLWKNNSNPINNWIKLNLIGTQSNRDAIGSTIKIVANMTEQYRYTHCGEGYLSQNSATQIVGVGTATVIDELQISWPSGLQESYTNLPVNVTLTFTEGSTLNLDHNTLSNLTVYPNPVSTILQISSHTTIVKVEIYNSLGQRVKVNRMLINNQLDVSRLNPGIYVINIFSGDSISSMKFIKE